MAYNHYFKDLVENIKRTDEMIVLHRNAGSPKLILEQYEAIKSSQISELIHELVKISHQKIESISIIKRILDKFYPQLPADIGGVEMLDLEGVDIVQGTIHIVDLQHDRVERIFDM